MEAKWQYSAVSCPRYSRHQETLCDNIPITSVLLMISQSVCAKFRFNQVDIGGGGGGGAKR